MSYPAAMRSPEKIKELRTKMIEHLEKAIAAADETGDYVRKGAGSAAWKQGYGCFFGARVLSV